MTETLQYIVATLLPVVASMGLFLLMRNSRLRDASYWTWQVIVGVVFGAIAIYGTEFGISIDGATINVRDAAPITAGLVFGGPAGIIAGVIGGVERWFAALWGRGMFTRVACSVATILAGVYAALLHHFIFDERKPSGPLGFAIGATIEVLHLMLVFLTNTDDPNRAFSVVQQCTAPMVTLNGLSVALSIIAVGRLNHEPLLLKSEDRTISDNVLSSLLFMFVFAFALTTGFTDALQTALAEDDTSTLLSINIQDVRSDITKASNDGLLGIAHKVVKEVPSCEVAKRTDLAALAEKYSVQEIHAVGTDGIIVASSDERLIGFDMSSGEQSQAFLTLLPGGKATEFVQKFQPMSYDETVWRKYAGVSFEDGFLQVAYNPQQFQDDLAKQVVGSTEHRHVGETGFILIVNEEGEIVSSVSSSKVRKLSYTSIDKDVMAASPRELFETTYLTTPCFGMYEDVEGYMVIALQPVYEADYSRNVAVIVGSFMVVIVFAALFTMTYYVIKRLVVDGIRRVNGRLAQITSGNLDVEVDVRNNKELSALSDDINHTVSALKGYIAEAAARIDQELEYARQIQSAALPQVFPFTPENSGFDIYASMDPAKQVGGDFYDFYMLDNDHFVFLVADVSGKGIPASLFMMRAKSELKSSAERGDAVNDVLANVNDRLCEGNDANMFVTAWMGILDLRTGEVAFANAGHNPPALYHPETGWSLLSMRKNLVLGFMEGVPYRCEMLVMRPGDIIYLYTDGVVEAMDEQDNQYGPDRMLATLARYSKGSAKRICQGVRRDMSVFVGQADQFDDITMLALRFEGGRAAVTPAALTPFDPAEE